jgi:hypothetical protein
MWWFNKESEETKMSLFTLAKQESNTIILDIKKLLDIMTTNNKLDSDKSAESYEAIIKQKKVLKAVATTLDNVVSNKKIVTNNTLLVIEKQNRKNKQYKSQKSIIFSYIIWPFRPLFSLLKITKEIITKILEIFDH